MSDMIEPVEDYAVQVCEVVETFHNDGKCVGCGHSLDSWCKKHEQWGYAISKCGTNGVIVKGERKSKRFSFDAEVFPDAKPDAPKQHYGGVKKKPVYCVTTKTWYPSADAAVDALSAKGIKIGVTNIYSAIKGVQRTAGGMQWVREGQDIPPMPPKLAKQVNSGTKARKVMILETGVTYRSISEASEVLGFSQSTAHRRIAPTNPNRIIEYVAD